MKQWNHQKQEVVHEPIQHHSAAIKQCSSSRLSHKQCYEEFGQYLKENHLYLSQKATGQWIEYIQEKYNRQKCYFWRQYLR